MRDKQSGSATGVTDPATPGRTMIAQRFRSLLTSYYHASIVRRTAVLMIFVGPAFLANLLVYFFTARILTPENFGLFYVAITIGNVAYSGSLLLNIFFTRYLVEIGATHADDLVAATRSIQRVVGIWGAILSLAGFVLLTALSQSLGVQSILVVLLIVLDTYTAYLADLGRAYLQSRQQTWQLGSYTFIWMALRLVLCVLGAALFGTVWAALLGSALAGALSFAGFQFVLAHASIATRHDALRLPAFANLIPTVLGYGLLILISNLDILLIYFLIPDGAAIGIYSASSVFPKGILMVTMPVSQLLFAVMLEDHKSQHIFRTTARTTIWVIVALTAAAALAVWLLSPWLCGGSFGLKLCAPAPLHILLVSAVILSVLRMTVLLEFVRQRDWLILSLLLPTLVYLLVAYFSKPGLETIALQFTVFAAATLAFFTAIQLGAAFWRRAERPQQESA
jgi:O-antigen/teichoic acid export membrane protein